jgi:hypothetical protein
MSSINHRTNGQAVDFPIWYDELLPQGSAVKSSAGIHCCGGLAGLSSIGTGW